MIRLVAPVLLIVSPAFGDLNDQLPLADEPPRVETVLSHEHAKETHAVAIGGTPPKAVIAYGSPANVLVLDLESRKPKLHAGGNWVRSVAVSPDGDSIALGRSGGAIDLIDAATGATRRSLDGRGKVNGVGFSADGRTLVSTHQSARIVAWNVADGTANAEHALPRAGWGAKWSPDGKWVLLAVEKGRLATWSPGDNELRLVAADVPRGQGTWVKAGRIVRPSAQPAGLVVQRTDNGRIVRTISRTVDIRGFARFIDERFLLTGDGQGDVRLWDVSSGQCCVLGRVPGRMATSITASDDGRYVVAGGKLRHGGHGPATVVWRLPDALLRDPSNYVRRHAEPLPKSNPEEPDQ